MLISPRLKSKYLTRFDDLIAEGERIHAAIEVMPGTWHEPFVRSNKPHKDPDTYHVDWPSFIEWRERTATLLDQLIPPSSVHRDTAKDIKRLGNTKDHVEYLVAILKARKSDFENGMLDSVAMQIEVGIAEDYLVRATALLGDESTEAVHRLLAAMVAGVVLERSVRILCAVSNPPIPSADVSGRPIQMSRLIDDLKTAGVLPELKAKQLRAFADIRNAAAHGQLDKIKRSDVAFLLEGVKVFLADYLI